MKIGEKIKMFRMQKGWSLQELADRMGYANKSTVARAESGEVDLPQSKILKFAEVLGVSVAELMNWEEVQKKNDTLADIVLRMRSDDDFLSIVETLTQLQPEQLASVKHLLNAFLK